MSSLDFTYDHIDDVLPRGAWVAPTIDPARTMLLVLDVQNLIVSESGAAYVKSVGGAPEGKDTIEPIKRVLEACRDKGIPVVWSLWGLRPDGMDAGLAKAKWPGLDCGSPASPASWGNESGDDLLHPEMKPLDGEPVMYKHRFSSFYNTPLEEYLRENDRDTLIIIGVTSANCMHATTIDGWNKNYKIICVADTTTAVPAPNEDQPLGYGQHWEALRNIQMNYGDVLLSTELIEKLK
ncbi:isochorismatase family cysteine hydrolase [Nocardioides aquiterrae]|uniref:Isochorismatase-like domain-containing protein n=1 Tax=Nocardioides aquiterrae TaxID=203799 RepID=A0ABN1U6W2_9ACTN